MGKSNNNNKVAKQSVNGANKKAKESSSKQRSFMEIIFANIIASLVLLFVLYIAKKNDVGYTFMWDTLVKNNYEMIKENGHITDEQKNLQRHGTLYKYLSDIVAKTPEDAIILMPADSSIDKMDAKYKMEGLKFKKNVAFFLYPRKAVYEKNKIDKGLISKANYVAIFAGDGYGYVANPPAKKEPFTVIKIK